MAVVHDGIVSYENAVVDIKEHYWLDGMVDVFAICWDSEQKGFVNEKIGYYGSDGQNLMKADGDVDVSPTIAREILRSMKLNAKKEFAVALKNKKQRIHKGDTAMVVRGRKVPKGTLLNVFWVGEKETHKSRQYSWMHETEEVAGAYDEDGNKVWIKTEYLKNLTPCDNPSPKERRLFVQNWLAYNLPAVVLQQAQIHE